MIAALYVDPRGPYPAIAAFGEWDGQDWEYPGKAGDTENWCAPVDCWGLPDRDARLYDGPYPIVAHPPCGPWGRLRHLYRGNEHDCAPRAVEQVRRWGGVLEHPARSLLWGESLHGFPLPPPPDSATHWGVDRDSHGGYTIEVCQVEWGHVARKRTWLYLVGVPLDALEAPPFPGREPTHWISGGGSGRGAVPPGIKVCSAQQRRRTPPLFAEYLVGLARAVRAVRA